MSFEILNAQGFSNTEVLDFCTTMFLKSTHLPRDTYEKIQGAPPHQMRHRLQ